MGESTIAALKEAVTGSLRCRGQGLRVPRVMRGHWRAAVFVVYLAVVVCVMAFHEPWFDEAQSWLIARDASFHDILLVRPHYEGHPPLWWLMLSVPAKLGVPYEIGLKGVQLVCVALMAGLLIFRSPFPPVAAALLPFTYFMCFQYGVTSRPYALMCASLFMVADCWQNRDRHPWRLVLGLMLLCCTSSYGIALACAVALVWVTRAVRQTHSPRALVADPRRFVAWLVLVSTGLALTACILPYPDTFGVVPSANGNSGIAKFLMFWFVLPSESMFTSFAGDVSLHGMRLGVPPIAVCAVLSALVWAALIRFARRRGDLDILLVPYLLFAVCAVRYFSLHHLGIIFALLVADWWIMLRDRPLEAADAPERLRHALAGLSGRDAGSHHRSAAGVRNAVIVVLLLPSLWWNIAAAACDARYDYSGARAVASFVERNGLEHDRWVSFWRYYPETTWPDGSHTPRQEDTHRYSWAVIEANPYLDGAARGAIRGSASMNVHGGSLRDPARGLLDCTYRGRSYEPNQVPSASQMDREIEACAAKGEPEFVIGDTDFPDYYFKRLGYRMRDYRKIAIATKRTPWKTWITTADITAYVRTDVLRGLRLG